MSGPERVREEGQEIVLDQSWLERINVKAEHARQKFIDNSSKSPTMLRVPSVILATNPEAYKPKIISLGPFHRQRLQECEDRIKWPYLIRFLARNKPRLDMLDYIKVIKDLEQEARSAYPKELEMDSNEFAEMMLLDCCFLLEYLLVHQPQPTQPSPQQQLGRQPEEDPITNIAEWWSLPTIRYDILMLENQLPLFLLWSLFEKAAITCSTHGPITFNDLILNFFRNCSLFPKNFTSDVTSLIEQGKCHHLLHLFHRCMTPQMPPGDDDYRALPPMRCARELREAKVKLVIKKGPSNVLDIRFQKPGLYDVASFWSGRLEIPQLCIYDFTERLFRNLIAFEQCFPEVGNYVVAYAWFMDSIVDDRGDVALLRQRNIVVNWLGSDNEVAQLFNNLFKDVLLNVEDCYLRKVANEVAAHCEKCRNECWARFKHTYFGNPWAGVSVAAAIILFVLTFLQTLYTILSYLKQRGH